MDVAAQPEADGMKSEKRKQAEVLIGVRLLGSEGAEVTVLKRQKKKRCKDEKT